MKNNNLHPNLVRSLFLLATIMSSCNSIPPNSPFSKVNTYYRASIIDASFPEIKEINYDLTAITPDNEQLIWKEINGKKYLLVTTWTGNTSFYPDEGAYNSGQYPIWVTVAPELLNWYQDRKRKELKDIDLRLKQLLGLPPNAQKGYFVTFWITPEDLFRPCADKEVMDTKCDMCFQDESDKEHIAWIENLRNASYYNCTGDKYPWTQLGYTYDWYPKNKSHVGLSEFVIKFNSDILVAQKYTTEEYLEQK